MDFEKSTVQNQIESIQVALCALSTSIDSTSMEDQKPDSYPMADMPSQQATVAH